MTAHELARHLLQFPNYPIAVIKGESKVLLENEFHEPVVFEQWATIIIQENGGTTSRSVRPSILIG